MEKSLDDLTTVPLPGLLEARRRDVLAAHREGVDELTTRFRRAWDEMLGHEVFVHRLDGMDEGTAIVAAANNLGVKRKELEEEMIEAIGRLFEDLRRKLTVLIEDAEDWREI